MPNRRVVEPFAKYMGRTARLVTVLLSPVLAACAHGSLPVEVRNLVDRRDTCDHFRGEVPDPGDRACMDELNEMLAKYCTGTDAELADLQSRHYANAAVTGKQNVYERKIEAKPR
jgi:hypothetical protein